MNEKIKKIAKLINEADYISYQLRSEFEMILGKSLATEMIESFEKEFESYPPKKRPHYCFAFYVALLILVENTEFKNLSEIVVKKKSYRLMKLGMQLFLSGKSQNLNYGAELSEKRYHNKYEYASFVVDNLPNYQIQFKGYINVLELVYEVSKDEFWKLLIEDKHNLIALCFLLHPNYSYEYVELLPILKSEDDIKSNAGFYSVMKRFNRLVKSYQYEETEEINRKLQQEIVNIRSVIANLATEKKVHFIINYLFSEAIYPSFFIEILQKADRMLVLAELEAKDLTNLFKLVHLSQLLVSLGWEELEELFVNMFLLWVENEANPHVWQQSQETVYEIINILCADSQDVLIDGLLKLKSKLYITSFDRQIRYPLFLKDESKAMVIDEILTSNLQE